MASSLITVRTFGNSVEAHAARSRLDAGGIPCVIEDEATVTALSYVGSALGGVKLRVRAEDASAALSILNLQPSAKEASESKPWLCGGCGELIESGFDVCWSCGAERDGRNAEQPGNAAEPLNPRQAAADRVLSAEPAGSGDASGRVDGESPSAAASNGSAGALVVRAWRAAVIGLVLFPGLLHLYSLWLLLRAASELEGQSNDQTLRYYGTAVIDILVLSTIVTAVILLNR